MNCSMLSEFFYYLRKILFYRFPIFTIWSHISKMILRNRDLNIQQKDAEQQKRKASSQLGLGAVKRQAAHLIKEETKEQNNEPKPKRTCKDGHTSSSIFHDFSNTLCIDSANRKSVVEGEMPKLPSPVPLPQFEFDQENVKDFTAVSDYVQEIFTYYKFRERSFRVFDYLKKHPELELHMRTKIVNWLIELQETFELNHETLYLAVKLFDMFLDRTPTAVQPKELQLIASAAVFVASKFDERSPPLIDDFIYMAEDGFTREQMMAMERELLKVIQFDLGAPLSYRFLRRYARVAKEDMGTLTLARYVLETSLMSLHYSRISESLIAAASLLLAKRMKGTANDTFIEILQKCSGYAIGELESLTWDLNRMLVQRKQLFGQHNDNVFRKYSHEIFFEVANISPLQEQHTGRNPHPTRRSSGSRPASRVLHN